jgi:hypothetical protein
VLAALAGKDIEKAARQAEESILEARTKLQAEEANIDAMLGGMDGAEYVGPRAPKLPPVVRSMEPREFTLAALKSLGADITPQHSTGGTLWKKTAVANGFASMRRKASPAPRSMRRAPQPSRGWLAR